MVKIHRLHEDEEQKNGQELRVPRNLEEAGEKCETAEAEKGCSTEKTGKNQPTLRQTNL